MTGRFTAALAAEWLKARRSKVPPLTFAAFTAPAGIAALFMVIVRDPERAQRLGLVSQKAQLSGLTADWTGLLDFLAQVVAVGGLLVFSFIATWVFGREFSDATARYLLALPIPRSTIVLAKFTLVTGWSLAVAVWLVGLFLGVGWLLRLPGWSAGVAADGVASALAAASLLLPAVAPVALVACLGRGLPGPAGERPGRSGPRAGRRRARLGRGGAVVGPSGRRRSGPGQPPGRRGADRRGPDRSRGGGRHHRMVAQR